MPNYSKYLLYYDSQIKAFREQYKKKILENRNSLRSWVEGLELERWYNYIRPSAPEAEIAFIVGLLCILYIDKEINITFSEATADKIKRSPKSEEEFQEWLKKAWK